MEIVEIKPAPRAGSLQPVPEAGTVQAPPSLHNPDKTTPTLKSGCIVYTCSLLFGEQWGFCLWRERVGVCLWQLRRKLRESVALLDGAVLGWGVLTYLASGVGPVVLQLDPCSSPADDPGPNTGPMAQPPAVWRPGVYHRGCAAAAAHYWAHFHHLETAPERHSSSLQGR